MPDVTVDISKLKNYGTKDIQIYPENILNLSECDYIDFKTEWYDYNGDLLYDILCFCNSISVSQNRFIIFGIEENSKTKEKTVHDIALDPNRKTNEDIEKILNEYFYISPKIEIHTFKIGENSIDILKITPNSATLPYHLLKKFDKKNDKCPNKKSKILLKNAIYARSDRTNYPIDEGVPHFFIEQLFAIRHGLHLTTRERGFLYLDDLDNWIFDNPEQIYYDQDCAYKIIVDRSTSSPQPLCQVISYSSLLIDTFLGTKFWETKKNYYNCSGEESYDQYFVKLYWHGNELFSFPVIDIYMKHYPLSGMIKTFFLPANYLTDYDRENTDPQIDLPETIEYKICRLLYLSENETGSNDEVLNYINWDYLRDPIGYKKQNPWIFDERPKTAW